MKIFASKTASNIIVDVLAVVAVAVILVGVSGEAAFAKGKPVTVGQSQSVEKSGGASAKGQATAEAARSKSKAKPAPAPAAPSVPSSSAGAADTPSKGSDKPASAPAASRRQISLSVAQTRCIVGKLGSSDAASALIEDLVAAKASLSEKRTFARAVRRCGEISFSVARINSSIVKNFQENLAQI